MRAALAAAVAVLAAALAFACGPAERGPVDEEGTPGHSQFFPTGSTNRTDAGHDGGAPDGARLDGGAFPCGNYVCQPGWACVSYSGAVCGTRETICVPNCAGMTSCQCAALNGHGCECNGGKCESSDGGAYAFCRDRVPDAG